MGCETWVSGVSWSGMLLFVYNQVGLMNVWVVILICLHSPSRSRSVVCPVSLLLPSLQEDKFLTGMRLCNVSGTQIAVCLLRFCSRRRGCVKLPDRHSELP